MTHFIFSFNIYTHTVHLSKNPHEQKCSQHAHHVFTLHNIAFWLHCNQIQLQLWETWYFSSNCKYIL